MAGSRAACIRSSSGAGDCLTALAAGDLLPSDDMTRKKTIAKRICRAGWPRWTMNSTRRELARQVDIGALGRDEARVLWQTVVRGIIDDQMRLFHQVLDDVAAAKAR